MSTTRLDRRLILSVGLLAVCGRVLAGEPFAIDWHTIDGGGGTSTGGDFELSGTMGQHDASTTLTGGDWELAGGFWPGVATTDLCAGVDCDDGVTCTVDACDSATGLCSNVADDSFCDDGLFCNGAETCDTGNDCQAGEPEPDCCKLDSDCDDGNACNGLESCDLAFNMCVLESPVDCDDGLPCTTDECDPDTGMCAHCPSPRYRLPL